MRKHFFLIYFILASAIALSFKGYAQEEVGEELKLYVGQVKMIPVNNPIRIAIGNPGVADVVEVTKSEMTVSPKGPGETTLVFWDNFGEQSYKIKVYAEDIFEAKRRIDNLLQKLNFPEVYTRAEEEEGKVLLLGRVKKPQDRERIDATLGALKAKTVDLIEVKEEEAVVEIDVQLLELNQDATRTLGFSWPSSISASEPARFSGGEIHDTMKPVVNVFNWSRSAALTLTINALVEEGKARVLSRPRLACQSGKEAELLVGGEKPIFTTSYVPSIGGTAGASTTVEYKEYGIKLKIKPAVTEEKTVKLGVNIEVSEAQTAETIGSSTSPTAKAVPLTKRTATTELYLNNGQTMAIGGLIKRKTTENVRKTPILGDIPIIGALFRKTAVDVGGGYGEKGDTELFITLTPTIISGKKDTLETRKEVKIARAPSGVDENLADPVKEYARIVQQRILENLTYPALAKEATFQGTVRLRLHISRYGELLDAQIKESSGHNMLDDHALSVAREAASYPPFPSSIGQEELWIEVPIAYQLD